MLSDPLLADLVEPEEENYNLPAVLDLLPIPVVSAPLHVGDGLGEDLGEDGEEGEDSCAGHELGDLVDALINCLEKANS